MAARALPVVAQPRIQAWRVGSLRLSLPLAATMTLQAAVALSLRNSAFQDEALYVYAGRQLVQQWLGGPKVAEPYGSYFSGMPYVYPIIAGALDIVGGLALVRLFSLACMLVASGTVYLLGRRFFGEQAGLLGAAAFAVEGSVLFLSHFATFDAMCLALLGVAAVLTGPASRSRWPGWAAVVGLVSLLAVASKYAGLLFVPTVLALLWLQSVRQRGRWRATLACVVAVLPLVAAPAALRGTPMWAGLVTTTAQRAALLIATRGSLILQCVQQAGALALLGLVGLVLVLRQVHLGPKVISLVLWGTVLLAPAYHVYKMEPTSLQKHLAFGMLFAAPLAGCALAWLSGSLPARRVARRWPVGLAVLLILFAMGLRQGRSLFHEWGNTDALIQTLRMQVRPTGGRILADEDEVPRYYLQDVVSFWQWNHLYWFDYTDAAGHYLQGEAAYKAALRAGYWDLVELHYGANARLAHSLDPILRGGGKYQLIAKLPFTSTLGNGYYWVWEKK
ncbi:MAG: ArnT family glycosyltransferase, partial [Chloroflexota bacterium]